MQICTCKNATLFHPPGASDPSSFACRKCGFWWDKRHGSTDPDPKAELDGAIRVGVPHNGLSLSRAEKINADLLEKQQRIEAERMKRLQVDASGAEPMGKPKLLPGHSTQDILDELRKRAEAAKSNQQRHAELMERQRIKAANRRKRRQ